MAQQYKIVATIGQSVGFNVFEKDGMGNAVLDQSKKIVIKGGAGIYDAESRKIPTAEETIVSQDELDQLRANPLFANWEKVGFLVVTSKREDSIKVASNMEEKDGSAQRTTSDLPKETNVVNRNGEVVVEVEEKAEKEKISVSAKKSSKKKSK